MDAAVPRTLQRLNEFLRTPGTTSKRAAFAVLRIVENMVSSDFSYCGDFLSTTAIKVSEDASTLAAKAIVRAVTLTLGGAVTLISATKRSARWLGKNRDIVQYADEGGINSVACVEGVLQHASTSSILHSAAYSFRCLHFDRIYGPVCTPLSSPRHYARPLGRVGRTYACCQLPLSLRCPAFVDHPTDTSLSPIFSIRSNTRSGLRARSLSAAV